MLVFDAPNWRGEKDSGSSAATSAGIPPRKSRCLREWPRARRATLSPSRTLCPTRCRDSSELSFGPAAGCRPVSYTHLRAHETPEHLVCRLLLEKKKKNDN